MRIQRANSRFSFRRRRRRTGCLPWALLLGVIVGILAMSWTWLERRLTSVAAPQTEPGDLVTGARDAFARGDLDQAITLSRQALGLAPQRPDSLVLLARSLIYRSYVDYDTEQDRVAALELTSEAIALNPDELDLRATHAFALMANRQPAAAADAAEWVLERNPEHAFARTGLALAYGVAGSYEIALRESLRAVRSNPGLVDAQRALAITYADSGNYDSAIRTVEIALTINSRLIPLYFERALYALQIGDADAATAAYMQVLTLDNGNVKARLRLCELSSLLREREAAIGYCSQVTQLAPTWADGWFQLGREYFLQGNFEAAQRNLNQCARLQVMQGVAVEERRFECWYLQGQAAEIRGDCDALIATYNEFRAMALDSSIEQTWTYPPEGPPGCTSATGSSP